MLYERIISRLKTWKGWFLPTEGSRYLRWVSMWLQLLLYTSPSFGLGFYISVCRTAKEMVLMEHTPEAFNPVRYVDEAVHERVELLVYRLHPLFCHQTKADAIPLSKER